MKTCARAAHLPMRMAEDSIHSRIARPEAVSPAALKRAAAARAALAAPLLKAGLVKLVTDVLLDPADAPAASDANERSQRVLAKSVWNALSQHKASPDSAIAREAHQVGARA